MTSFASIAGPACLSVCPEGAVQPISSPVAQLSRFSYKVIVPTAVLYSQFDLSIHPYIIHCALHELGFDLVVDVAPMSAMAASALTKYMRSYRGRLLLISCYCPSVLRLIQVKYPDLVELLVPIDVPREITAREIRRALPARLGISPTDLGILYVATCPAKIVSIRQPAEKSTSWFDGAVPVRDVFTALLPHVIAIKQEFDESQVSEDFHFDRDWVLEGCMVRAARTEREMAVSGLDHVRKILDDIENSRLRNVDFIEAQAHMLGCVGGPYVCGVCRVSINGATRFACVHGPDFEGGQVDWAELLQRRKSYMREEVVALRSGHCAEHSSPGKD